MQLNEVVSGTLPNPDGDSVSTRGTAGGTLLMAALALPGIVGVAHAEVAPERAQIDVNFQNYRDWQPGLDRITVHSPSVRLLVPFAGQWAVESAVVSDIISGATPRYHTAASGASAMSDHRNAESVSVTRYFVQGSVRAGLAHSSENDYQSRAYSLEGTFSTEDRNTTINAGIGVSNDTINPVNGLVIDAKKHVLELQAGVTQILTQRDIVQLELSHAAEHGYLNDPYKDLDQRPDSRDRNSLQLRWNHHFDSTGGTGRFGYRYYRDSYGIRAHTLNTDYIQPLPQGWTVTPSARFYTQTAARFYFGPVYSTVLGEPIPAGYAFASGSNISEDYRLSAFGALTIGLKLEKQVTRDVRVSVQVARYEQRSNWAWSGNNGPGLAPLHAQMINIGFSKQF